MFRFGKTPLRGHKGSQFVSHARINFSTIRLYEYTEYRRITLKYFDIKYKKDHKGRNARIFDRNCF